MESLESMEQQRDQLMGQVLKGVPRPHGSQLFLLLKIPGHWGSSVHVFLGLEASFTSIGLHCPCLFPWPEDLCDL